MLAAGHAVPCRRITHVPATSCGAARTGPSPSHVRAGSSRTHRSTDHTDGSKGARSSRGLLTMITFPRSIVDLMSTSPPTKFDRWTHRHLTGVQTAVGALAVLLLAFMVYFLAKGNVIMGVSMGLLAGTSVANVFRVRSLSRAVADYDHAEESQGLQM